MARICRIYVLGTIGRFRPWNIDSHTTGTTRMSTTTTTRVSQGEETVRITKAAENPSRVPSILCNQPRFHLCHVCAGCQILSVPSYAWAIDHEHIHSTQRCLLQETQFDQHNFYPNLRDVRTLTTCRAKTNGKLPTINSSQICPGY